MIGDARELVVVVRVVLQQREVWQDGAHSHETRERDCEGEEAEDQQRLPVVNAEAMRDARQPGAPEKQHQQQEPGERGRDIADAVGAPATEVVVQHEEIREHQQQH